MSSNKTSTKTNCKFEDCDKIAVTKKRGFCKEHDRIKCKYEGCEGFAVSRIKGLCRKHDKGKEVKEKEDIHCEEQIEKELPNEVEKAFNQPFLESQLPIRFIYDPNGIEKIPEKKKGAKYEYFNLDDVIEFCEDMEQKQKEAMVEMMDSFCINDDVNPMFRVRLKEIRNNKRIIKAQESYESSLRSTNILRLAMALKRIP
jgi:hypothetical protein